MTATIAPQIPLVDSLPTDTYLGYPLGRYPQGEVVPAAHWNEGVAAATATAGWGGRFALVSIGPSHPFLEFNALQRMIYNQPAGINFAQMEPLNGAQPQAPASSWDSPTDPAYDAVDALLAQRGLTPGQVRAVWLKLANAYPANSLLPGQPTDPLADAVKLLGLYGRALRALRVRYRNLAQAFVSNRSYGGYGVVNPSVGLALNPEPFAYESGLALKWLVASQIAQNAGAAPDPVAGDLRSPAVAPWAAWGPDLWANGTAPRAADGLAWLRSDFKMDGCHPSQQGAFKAAQQLRAFLGGSPFVAPWFLSD